MNGGIWKYIAIVSLSGFGGLLVGQYNPNRNIVTTDQLDARIVPLQSSVQAEAAEISALRDSVNDLKGQLKAQKLLTGQ